MAKRRRHSSFKTGLHAFRGGTLMQGRARRMRKTRVRRRRNPLGTAIIANPGGALVRYSPSFAAYQMRKATKKKSKRRRTKRYYPAQPARKRRKRRSAGTMARKRKKRGGARRRRVYHTKARFGGRHKHRRRIRRAVRVSRRYARRYYKPRGKPHFYINPRRRRRRNGLGGGGGSLLKRFLVPYAAGFITSLATAVVDAQFSSRFPKVARLGKVGAAIAIAFFGRRWPAASNAAIASLASAEGYTIGLQLAGGFTAPNPAAAVQGLASMAQTYPEMGALLQGGVGALLQGMGQGPENTEDVVANYGAALQDVADDD